MKKIMIMAAFAAAALGAKAQTYVCDNQYDNDYDIQYTFTTAWLDENYADYELENMLTYTYDLVCRNHPKDVFYEAYKIMFKSGMMHERENMETMLVTLFKKFPNEVYEAKKKVDKESIWDF